MVVLKERERRLFLIIDAWRRWVLHFMYLIKSQHRLMESLKHALHSHFYWGRGRTEIGEDFFQ